MNAQHVVHIYVYINIYIIYFFNIKKKQNFPCLRPTSWDDMTEFSHMSFLQSQLIQCMWTMTNTACWDSTSSICSMEPTGTNSAQRWSTMSNPLSPSLLFKGFGSFWSCLFLLVFACNNGTLTFLFVSTSSSVGCPPTFPEHELCRNVKDVLPRDSDLDCFKKGAPPALVMLKV